MDRYERNRRIVSAHRLPVSLALPRPLRASHEAAAFLTQLLGSSTPSDHAPVTREGEAMRRYRLAETSDQRRMPMGYRKSLSA